MKVDLGRGYETTIDDDDFDLVSSYTWIVIDGRLKNTTYAGAWLSGRLLYMHRLILSAPDNMQVDHVDSNGLNNIRANLRLATASQNAINKYYPLGSSDYVGVYWHKDKWRAKVSKDGEQHYLGGFDTEEEAAMARDEAALRIQGPFARLNFPKKG